MCELRDCPFCGGPAGIGCGRDGEWFVNCMDCLASTNVLVPQGDTEADAIAAWNSRVTDRYALTESGYRAVMQQGAKLNGEVKAGEEKK